MGKNSKIEWTDHTFNPWWGCAKVSPACDNCYAEAWARRVGSEVWGRTAARRFFSDKHWRQPLDWNDEAMKHGARRRVFCASMSDVFEARADLDPWRNRLWRLIEATPYLDWLLLTKRPHRIRKASPWNEKWPANIWLGTTAENQLWADARIGWLLDTPARVHFVSCEPLLGPVNLRKYLRQGLDWVIAGGESGGSSRPSLPSWIRSLRDQCKTAGVPFHFKQWGNWVPANQQSVRHGHRKFKVLESEVLIRMPKSTAGRILDGDVWDELPTT